MTQIEQILACLQRIEHSIAAIELRLKTTPIPQATFSPAYVRRLLRQKLRESAK